MKTIEQTIFETLDVNVKETRLVVEFVAIIAGETERDVVTALMNLVDDKRITLVAGGEDAYVYCTLYKSLNEDVLAELAEKEAEAEVKREEALKNIVW
jgi:hypothetical protein